MFPSLQPTRPKMSPSSAGNPLHQQQQRSVTIPPRSQIEAMPPLQAPVESRMSSATFNPATTHPVFFTAWRKPPFQIPVTNALSPVATGYVFGDPRRRDNNTKL